MSSWILTSLRNTGSDCDNGKLANSRFFIITNCGNALFCMLLQTNIPMGCLTWQSMRQRELVIDPGKQSKVVVTRPNSLKYSFKQLHKMTSEYQSLNEF